MIGLSLDGNKRNVNNNVKKPSVKYMFLPAFREKPSAEAISYNSDEKLYYNGNWERCQTTTTGHYFKN